MLLKTRSLGSVLFIAAVVSGEAPYPPSSVITDMSLDWSTHRRQAIGSDNWQLTWAQDDHQYGAWGDGGGFGGTNSNGRVGLGFGRIEGDWDNYRGFNVWGGKNPENPAHLIIPTFLVYGKNNDSLNTVRGTFNRRIRPARRARSSVPQN